MNKQKISACMIIRDESIYLKDCLNSIKGLADEVIIVDTGSKDNSINIAREFTDKIFKFEWCDDFSKARNFSISKATHPWILIIDADERILEEDVLVIKRLINETSADAIKIKWRDYYNNKKTELFKFLINDQYKNSNFALGYDTQEAVRLFKNLNGYYFEGLIHETINHSVEQNLGKIIDSNIVIHHIGNIEKNRYLIKKKKYLDLLKKRWAERDFVEKPEHFICYEIVKEALGLKDFSEASLFLERAIELTKNPFYISELGLIYFKQNRIDLAEKTLKTSIELNPFNYTAHLNLGVVYLEKKEYLRAIKKFERTLELNPKCSEAYFNLGVVFKNLKKQDKMQYNFNRAIELNPLIKENLDTALQNG